MTSVLILTVGTGTAGKHSDVAQGLANTIRQVRPRKFWLVPSASDKSTPVADLIRETVAGLGSFAQWSQSVGRGSRGVGGRAIAVLKSPVANCKSKKCPYPCPSESSVVKTLLSHESLP